MKRKNESEASVIRERFGISQQELAYLLGVSRGHLAMIDSKNRTLPLHAAARIAQIQQHHYGNPASVEKELQQPPQKVWAAHHHKTLRYAIHKKNNQMYRLQQELEDTKKKYAQAVHLAHFVHHLKQDTELTEDEKQWIKKHESQAQLNKHKYGWAVQQMLQLEIDSLLQYIDNAGKLLKKMDKHL